MATASYRNYIDGRWVDAVAGDRFENRNPADATDLIGHFPHSSQDDVRLAVEAGRLAFLSAAA